MCAHTGKCELRRATQLMDEAHITGNGDEHPCPHVRENAGKEQTNPFGGLEDRPLVLYYISVLFVCYFLF